MNDTITELDSLKEQAKKLGIKHHANIGVDKLREKVKESLTGVPAVAPVNAVAVPVVTESISERNARLRRQANKQVRIMLTCMNPNKKAWQGEIVSVSNSAIGTIKKFIPFSAEDGYHVPVVLLNLLQERKYLKFKKIKRNGKEFNQPQQAKEFAIQILPNLTEKELAELATRQAISNNTGE